MIRLCLWRALSKSNPSLFSALRQGVIAGLCYVMNHSGTIHLEPESLSSYSPNLGQILGLLGSGFLHFWPRMPLPNDLTGAKLL